MELASCVAVNWPAWCVVSDFTDVSGLGSLVLQNKCHKKFIIPPYGSMRVFSFLCVCTVTDFSVVEKDRGVKFACVFDYYPDRSSPILVNFGSWGVTAAALLQGWAIYTSHLAKKRPTYKSYLRKKLHGEARWAVGIGCGLVWQSELGTAASRKALWCDLCLASLLTQLLLF